MCVSEVSKSVDPSMAPLQLALDIFDYCSLLIFILEIKLKWIDDFWGFWNNGWNIFDFSVTYFVMLYVNTISVTCNSRRGQYSG